MKPQLHSLSAIARAWRDGGFLDALMRRGPDHDRVKRYVRAFDAAVPAPSRHPLQRPRYPLFEGLDHLPWRPASAHPGAAALEAAFPTIRDAFLALPDDAFVHYTPPSMHGTWSVYLFHHMGVDVGGRQPQVAGTAALLRALPGVCLDYPWGDALFSVQAREAHLAAHCSIDNLRLRCHLGIEIPPGSELRVGTKTRTWREGHALLFEDSFEHEVWNRGAARRAVLIVDFWHPGLAPVETRALTAAFRKAEVRRLFMHERLAMVAESAPDLHAHLVRSVEAQDDEALLRDYWPA